MSVSILLFALPHFVLEAYTVERSNINDTRKQNSSVCSSIDQNEAVQDTRTHSLSRWAIYLTALTIVSVTALLPLWTTGRQPIVGSLHDVFVFTSGYAIIETETDQKRGARNIGLVNIAGNLIGSITGLAVGAMANTLWVHPLQVRSRIPRF